MGALDIMLGFVDSNSDDSVLNHMAIPTAFHPSAIASAPEAITALPDGDDEEKIAKAKAVLGWLMQSFDICLSYSGGKDSSVVAGLALSVAAELVRDGLPVKRIYVMHSDTLVENPLLRSIADEELKKMERWFAEHRIPGSVHIARPSLNSQFAVSVIGGRSLPSMPGGNRDCTSALKSIPLNRLRKQIIGRNDFEHAQIVCGVTGLRRSESVERAKNVTGRAESAVDVVRTSRDDAFLAPILEWNVDTVWLYLGLARNGLEHTYSDFERVIDAYRDATGECFVGLSENEKKGESCSSRFGCYTCLFVSKDGSMENLLAEPEHAYMRPLSDFRQFMAAIYFDFSKRTWIGRTISSEDRIESSLARRLKLGKKSAKPIPPGYIAYGPDVFSPDTLCDLLRYALTIDFDEYEEAERLGIAPRFQLISAEALIAIDAQWSLQGYCTPFAGLKIYTEIRDGARYYPPKDLPVAPRQPVPEPRYIYVGQWDDADTSHATGMRDTIEEMSSFDPEMGLGCRAIKEINTKHGVLMVPDVEISNAFEVDREAALLILDLEADRLVDEHYGAGARQVSIGGNASSTVGYRYYLRMGAISLSPQQLAKTDSILRRTAWKERMGLAGYNYDAEAAYAMSQAADEIEPHVRPDPQDVLREDTARKRAEKRAALKARGISLGELYRDWSPALPWRALIRAGALEAAGIPAHCSRARMAEVEHEAKRQIRACHRNGQPEMAGQLERRHAKKAWARWYRTDIYRLLTFLRNDPAALQAVIEHRKMQRNDEGGGDSIELGGVQLGFDF